MGAMISLLLFSSISVHAEKVMTFSIKKDKHTATNRCIRFVKGGQVNFNIFVSPGWVYDENAMGFQPGWNKLIGITDGLNQHKNSVRVAWRSIGDKIFHELILLRGWSKDHQRNDRSTFWLEQWLGCNYWFNIQGYDQQ